MFHISPTCQLLFCQLSDADHVQQLHNVSATHVAIWCCFFSNGSVHAKYDLLVWFEIQELSHTGE